LYSEALTVGILSVLRKDLVKAEKGNPILGPLHICPVLSLDRLRGGKGFHEAVPRAALICCQKHDERTLVFEPRGEGIHARPPCSFVQRLSVEKSFSDWRFSSSGLSQYKNRIRIFIALWIFTKVSCRPATSMIPRLIWMVFANPAHQASAFSRLFSSVLFHFWVTRLLSFLAKIARVIINPCFGLLYSKKIGLLTARERGQEIIGMVFYHERSEMMYMLTTDACPRDSSVRNPFVSSVLESRGKNGVIFIVHIFSL
jgi:hypothetical protein